MGTILVNQQQEKKIKYLPCVKCGSENIDFGDCGYSSFNVAWGKCKDCKNEVKINPCSWDISTEEIVKIWNRNNDPKILRKNYQSQIEEIQKLINALPS